MGKFKRGLFWGTIAGAVTGLLAAPRRGAETRKSLEKNLREVENRASEAADELKKKAEEYRPEFEKAGKALGEAFKEGRKEAKQASKEEEAKLRREVAEAGRDQKKRD